MTNLQKTKNEIVYSVLRSRALVYHGMATSRAKIKGHCCEWVSTIARRSHAAESVRSAELSRGWLHPPRTRTPMCFFLSFVFFIQIQGAPAFYPIPDVFIVNKSRCPNPLDWRVYHNVTGRHSRNNFFHGFPNSPDQATHTSWRKLQILCCERF